MRYLPHTHEDVVEMLQVVGAATLDDLFSSIPEDCRFKGELDLPPDMTEWELAEHMAALAGRMASPPEYRVFVGAGSYSHYIPASVPYLLSRSEFFTSYTPYQPEMSQGTLQAIFEYQTLTARLLGMEVANASMYDGASALAEALLMAVRISGGRRRRGRVEADPPPLPAGGSNLFRARPATRSSSSPTCPTGHRPVRPRASTAWPPWPSSRPISSAASRISRRRRAQAHAGKALSVISLHRALAYGLLKNPGSQGADIACGEGQSLGIPQSFGGPGLGMFASRKKYVRSMPGRLVGQTKDRDGRRGFVLTLATREQHIRREKATSNICTNNSLCALLAAMYHGLARGDRHPGAGPPQPGQGGISQRGARNRPASGFPSTARRFNEFVVEFPGGFEAHYGRLVEKEDRGRPAPGRHYPELAGHYLLCVTETAAARRHGRTGKGGDVMNERSGTTGLILNEPLLWEKGKKGRAASPCPSRMWRAAAPGRMIRGRRPGFPGSHRGGGGPPLHAAFHVEFRRGHGHVPPGLLHHEIQPQDQREAWRPCRGLPAPIPLLPPALSQGALRLMYDLERFLAEITGLDAVTLQPAAGAHGELTGMLHHPRLPQEQGRSSGRRSSSRTRPTAPTRPAPPSAAIASVPVPSGERRHPLRRDGGRPHGRGDGRHHGHQPQHPGALRGEHPEDRRDRPRQGRPGLRRRRQHERRHGRSSSMGEIGVDVLHLNLHKTFSTPHGGGGPGRGAGVRQEAPGALPARSAGGRRTARSTLSSTTFLTSIGRVHAFHGNFGVLVRAYSYILSMGPEDLKTGEPARRAERQLRQGEAEGRPPPAL